MTGNRAREWSLASGARAARDARIATARHLREAPIARLWHMTKLQRSYQIQLAGTGDPRAAVALLYGGMGYEPPYPADWEAGAKMVVGDEARYLAAADLYVLTPQMCDVVIAAAQTLTRADLELASEDDMPGMTGLVVLPHPLIVRAVTGDLADVRAFTWRFPAVIPYLGRRGGAEAAAVRMSGYHDSYGPVRPDSFRDFAARAAAQGTPLPPLLLDAIRCLPLQYAAAPEQIQALDEHVATARSAGETARQQAQALGAQENRVVGEYTPGAEINDGDDTFMPRFLFAFWRLCQQRIAASDVMDASHSAQTAAGRAGVSPDVRIVRLRRSEPAEAQGGSREWRHRWPVRMHKVNQWYPSLGRHKVLYRGPYLKGPADKPLIGGEPVWALVR